MWLHLPAAASAIHLLPVSRAVITFMKQMAITTDPAIKSDVSENSNTDEFLVWET
jgi:hypothetical protein